MQHTQNGGWGQHWIDSWDLIQPPATLAHDLVPENRRVRLRSRVWRENMRVQIMDKESRVSQRH